MRDKPVRGGRSFLLRLLLPLLLLICALALMGLAALYYMKDQHGEVLALQRRTIAVLHEVVGISQEMASVQRLVGDVLERANAGQLDEAAVYRMHTGIVDRLAQTGRRVQGPAGSPVLAELLPGEGEKLRQEFESYRNYVVMATDLAAIEPALAGQHIARARDQFDAFHFRVMGAVHRLSEHVETTGEASRQESAQVMQRTTALLLGGFVVAFILSLFGARVVARRVDVVAQALSSLAEGEGMPPPLPDIERLRQTEHNEFGRLASSVLSLRQAVKDRYQADLKLKEYQLVLERTIDQLSASQRSERELHGLAFYDALTGLPNRRLMLESLHKAIRSCKRRGCSLALLFIDLNKFKLLNDTHGHGAGDLLLKEVADRLLKTVRASDTVARLGGDEFVVLLEDLPADQGRAAERAQQMADKIGAILSEGYLLGNLHYKLSASVGVSIRQDGEPGDILHAADEAMYAAKRTR